MWSLGLPPRRGAALSPTPLVQAESAAIEAGAALLPITPLLPDTERLADLGLRIGLTLLIAWLAQWLLFLAAGRAEKWMVRAGRGTLHAQQRARTLGQIARHLVTVLVAATAAIRILDLLGWDVKPILAGAGIVGVALGFGAQTLVRDVIAGVFILAEDQFGVGDVVEVDGKAATVEAVTVRATRLRDFRGHVYFVPNGEMKIVVNRSRDWNRVVVDVPLAADADWERGIQVCREVAEAMNADEHWKDRLLEPVQMTGIETLTGPEAVLRVVCRARPGAEAAEAARELRRRLLRALQQSGVRTHPMRDGLQAATAESRAPRTPV